MRRTTTADRTDGCGCPGHDSGAGPSGRGFSRRSFLKRGAAVAAATSLTGTQLATQLAFASSPAYAGDTVVVLSFRGGFDGLSVVVPRGDANFAALRPNIRVPDAALLSTGDSRFGLHPGLAPLLPFWQAGTFGAVHAVGQDNPSRSHFEAMEEMERAAPGSSLRTGWIDRLLTTRGQGTSFQGCQVGSTSVSSAFIGPSPELGMYRIDDFNLSGSSSSADLAAWDAALRGLNAGAPTVVGDPVATTLGALAQTGALTDAGYTEANGAVYDTNSDLAMSLRDVARLIKANIGLQMAAVDYGDWDMHSGLAVGTLDPSQGWMFDKMTELAGALAAFYTDLGPTLMAKTTLITLSEFGRRVEENGSHGVDHGHGNAVLLMGGGIVGGQVHGVWPGLSDSALNDGDLDVRTDYRNLLGEILVKRCGAGSVGSVFPGLTYTPIGIAHP